MKANFVTVLVLAASMSSIVQMLDYEYHPQLSYYYADTTFIGVNQPVSSTYNATVIKCKCEGNEAWNSTECVTTQTKVAIYDPHNGQTTAVDTGQFQEVRVDQPQCPEGHVLATLDSLRDSENQFSLLPSGHLYWQQRQFQLYCIEHWVDDDGKLIGWFAEVCLWPPSVPRCCPQGQTLSTDLSCSSRASQELAPPVMVDGVEVRWSAEAPGQVEEVDCLRYQDILTKNLTYPETFLNYSPDKASLVWSPISSQKKEQRGDFCVGEQDGRGYIVRVCYEDKMASHVNQCDQSTCVRKCCEEQEILDVAVCTSAVSANELWTPSFYDSEDFSANASFPGDMKLIFGFPLCDLFFMLEPHNKEDDKFLLLNDGNLYVFQDRYPPTDYCIDNVRGIDGVIRTQALVCFKETPARPVCDATLSYLYPALLLVSCVFLAATLVTYASVPDLRNKLNGKSLISLVSALLVGYMSLAIASLAKGKMPPVLCRITASLMHLSFLAAFFWLSAICFDIWRALRKMRTVSSSRAWIRRRFLLYSLYSWGCPLVITIVAIIVEELPDTYTVIRPDFGTDFCWFTSRRSIWLYFYMFVLVLVVANLIFFVLVAVLLCRSAHDSMLKPSREANRDRLWLCFKLFLVMGVTWLAEVISWKEGSCTAWIVTDVINTLQGLSIFLVFVCKRRTYYKIRDRCCGPLQSASQGPSTTQTNTSGSRDSGRSRASSSLKPTRASEAVPLNTLENTNQKSAGNNQQNSSTPGPEKMDHKESEEELNTPTVPPEPSGRGHGESEEGPLAEETTPMIPTQPISSESRDMTDSREADGPKLKSSSSSSSSISSSIVVPASEATPLSDTNVTSLPTESHF